jgi:hypothetical protein
MGCSVREDHVKSLAREVIGLAALFMVAAGVGALTGITSADDAREVARLHAENESLTSRATRAETDEARLRAERNRLEAQIAAGAPPPVCPEPRVSSGDLFAYFTVEYPCGWSVVAHVGGMTDDASRAGMTADLSLFSQLPVSLAREGPIADMELAEWSDDPAGGGEGLRTIDEWIAEERARFVSKPVERRFEIGGGITVTRLSGTEATAGQDHVVEVYLWEYVDAFTGARHVMRALAVDPGARARAALDRLVRSFEIVSR